MSESKCPRRGSDVPAPPAPVQGRPRTLEDLDELREGSDVYYDPKTGTWIFTRWDDVQPTLRDTRLSMDPRKAAPGAPIRRIVPLAEEGSMNRVDDPDHARLRRLVAKAYTARSLEQFRPDIIKLIDGLFDKVDGPFDVVESFAKPLALRTVACLFLGLPESMLPEFLVHLPDLSQIFNFAFPIERSLAAHASMKEIWARVLEQRRTKPEHDFISLLLDGRDDERLSDSELLCMLQVTFAAGNVSSAHMIGNAIVLLLENPDQREKLRQDPSLIKNAVEEVLRCEPVSMSAGRIAPEALEVRGCAIGAGESILLHGAAASRDPKVNPDPRKFDVTRSDVKHAAFGGGAHICIGAPMVRLEIELAIEGVMRRFPKLALDPSRPSNRLPFVNGRESIWVIPS